MSSAEKKQIHVAVAVITQQQHVLIALRKPDQHQGNLWEFPGGKVEAGETTLQALQREIHEELNLDVISAEPFMDIKHDYADKSVWLDIWRVEHFQGKAYGKEGQPLKWCPIDELDNYAFPEANTAIITAIQQSIINN